MKIIHGDVEVTPTATSPAIPVQPWAHQHDGPVFCFCFSNNRNAW